MVAELDPACAEDVASAEAINKDADFNFMLTPRRPVLKHIGRTESSLASGVPLGRRN
jgi:hypothetical protein